MITPASMLIDWAVAVTVLVLGSAAGYGVGLVFEKLSDLHTVSVPFLFSSYSAAFCGGFFFSILQRFVIWRQNRPQT